MIELSSIVEALRSADLLDESPALQVQVASVVEDSRRAEPGALFCAIEGTEADGHEFVADAAARGAVAALVTRRIGLPLPQVLVRDSRLAAGVAAREFYSCPAERIALIGVTGTNGKSTTVSIIRHLLNESESAGSIGTLSCWNH